MDLFILRHGDAAHVARSDQERCLTACGQEEAHSTLTQCQADLAAVMHMLVSPYVRAQQTAQIAAKYLPPAAVTQTCELLVPEANPQKLIDYLQYLQQQKQLSSVLLVSHQPLVGTLLNKLCGFEVGRYSMGTSALAAVKTDVLAAGLGQLQWLRRAGEDF